MKFNTNLKPMVNNLDSPCTNFQVLGHFNSTTGTGLQFQNKEFIFKNQWNGILYNFNQIVAAASMIQWIVLNRVTLK